MIPPKLIKSLRNAFWHVVPESVRRKIFRNSGDYWEKRYGRGGTSGPGSYGRFAAFKAEVLNDFVAEHAVASVIEFGSGDGSQLALAAYPKYLGIDVSRTAVEICRKRYAGDGAKHFETLADYKGEKADLALSLDVIYHLVEDTAFDAYMQTLFASAGQFVAVYSSDTDDNRDIQGPHIRHRKFTAWIEKNAPEWELLRHVPNKFPYEGDGTQGSFADFFFYKRTN
jgi:hypothetical protein